MRYEASFKPQNGGMEQTFRLDAQQYHALTVGDKGTLSYKGSRFEGLRRCNNADRRCVYRVSADNKFKLNI